MESKRQLGSSTPNQTGIVVGLMVVAVIVVIIVMAGHNGRHQHRAKVVKTKSHKIYVENDGGSCYEFVATGGDGADVDLPRAGSSSFKLPPGSWVKASPPKEEEIAEEEEEAVEESDAGQPEADAAGDVGSDSDGAAAPGDSGGSDSGGSDGGGGGDGGGGDGGN
jgi:uncharacterized membrane protein YgcG